MRRVTKWAGATMAAAFVAVAAFLAFLQLSGNFHAVSDGVVYRAAQMDGAALAAWQRDYGIASVLNLRGPSESSDWYLEEKRASQRLGIAHIDYPMSDQSVMSEDEVQALVQVMKDAPKPMLIHCRAGSDRTGLASLLYLVAVEGRDEEEAEWQLSLAFGHVGIPYLSRARAMDDTWERVEGVFGFTDS